MRKLAFVVAGLVAIGLGPSQLPSTAAAPPVSAAPAATASADEVKAKVPSINWRKCHRDFQCAKVDVPLDYDEPNGPTTTLTLLKSPARKPDKKIGPLFVNPGGPGGGAAEFAAFFNQMVKPAVANRFDIIGIDPRGVTQPTMKCVTNDPEPETYWNTPVNRRQATKIFGWDDWARGACENGYSPIAANMSTADTARDMDLIRQALEVEQLSYYGVSYGSYLGATYAAMFPDNFRALIVDSVIDPEQWATGTGGDGATIPFSTRIGSGPGAYEALKSAFKVCDRVGAPRCPLGKDSEKKWIKLLDALKAKPYRGLTWRGVMDYTLGGLYDSQYTWVMRDIRSLRKAVLNRKQSPSAREQGVIDRVRTGDASRELNERRGVPDRILDKVEAGGPWSWWGQSRVSLPFHGVACADTDNPTDPWAWWDQGQIAEQDAPWYTMTWTFASSTCAGWRDTFKEDRYAGPWDVDTATPVLIAGNRHDPATAISGARGLAELLPNNRLLETSGWGHGAITTSDCVDNAYAQYLIKGTLPEEGTVCKPDRPLFPAVN